jgi:two-component system heavy metal sensor histidine kinase CusS
MRPLKSVALTTRLGLYFALVAALTLTAVGAYLYMSLDIQLARRDDTELLGKVVHVRHLLSETTSAQSIRQDPHRFLDALTGHTGLVLVLKSIDGDVLFQNQADMHIMPPAIVVPLNREPDGTFLQQSTLASGVAVRTIAAWGATGKTGEVIHITLARTAFEKATLLAAYRNEVLLAVFSGVFLAILVGYVFVRQSLLPVSALARQAHSITAQRLDKRLDTASAPQELLALVQAFNAMLDRLHSSFQRLSQFSGDLAHDLRTPINNLMVQTQVALSQTRCVNDYQSLLVSNVEEYERMARMLDNMLFLARADEAQVKLSKQTLDAEAELQRIADYFEGIASEAGVRIEINAIGTVTADPILFRRAVNNLIANAIRYTPINGVIVMTSKTLEEHTIVSIVNPGPGIPKESIPHLFDRFYRGDRARSDSASSAGLGLAIVQSIAHLHGGRVEVESIPNQKTTFNLLFPASEVSLPSRFMEKETRNI